MTAPTTDPTGPTEPRTGRPRIRHDDEILAAALRAFAAMGFEAMSLRSLNAELGLSHGTINQRFGSKEQLWYAAIDHGFADFLADIEAERARYVGGDGPIDELAGLVRGFLRAAARRPELGRLMNQEGLEASARLEHIVTTVIEPGFAPITATLERLARAGHIHPISTRALFFLVAHGAEAPYTLTALSHAFDEIDGVLDEHAHADAMTAFVVRGLRRQP